METLKRLFLTWLTKMRLSCANNFIWKGSRSGLHLGWILTKPSLSTLRKGIMLNSMN